MDTHLKQRLVGATVLMALVIIFLPMLLDERPSVDEQLADTNVPDQPHHELSTDVLPTADIDEAQNQFESQSGVTALGTAEEQEAPETAPDEQGGVTAVEEAVSVEAPGEETVAAAVEQADSSSGNAVDRQETPKDTGVVEAQSAEQGAQAQSGNDRSTAQAGGDTASASESVADAQPETREGLTAWVIQVGSFSTQAKADTLLNKLKAGGFPVFSEQAYVNKKNVYRVRVGPELDRKNAETLQARMKKELKVSGIIVRYP